MDEADSKAAPTGYTIAAVDRALLVLEALADRPGQGLTQLSKSLGMTKSIVFRLLQTLEDRGFVFRDPDHAVFSLGYRIGVLGERVGTRWQPAGCGAPGHGRPARPHF